MANAALRLLHITDTHLFAAPDGRLRGINTRESLAAVLATASSQRPDAVLATGDLSQDETPGAYRHFRGLLAPLGLPVWCLPGNHDAPGILQDELAGPSYQIGDAAVAGCWAVLMLDSFIPGDHGGRLSAAELARLAAQLDEHRDRHVLVALHHHVLPLGSRWLDELGLYNAAQLLALLERAPQVRAVVSGHVHQATDVMHRGIRYLTTPSTCFQFLPGADDFALDTRPPGWRWLDLHPDGHIDTHVAWLDPVQLDAARSRPVRLV